MVLYRGAAVYKIVYHEDGVRWKLCAKDVECTNIMAVGVAIENMLLRATDMGIDSLWMGDIFYAYNELVEFLKIEAQKEVVSKAKDRYEAELEKIEKLMRKRGG